ncbi:Mn2+/Fe2+ NRAMP family transporter [Saccharopolyspora erythraea NRRL 2338]|uniref:Mn2+ and Fe2+ transporters of the NRAMP family-like protein n=2 Tax=Saccharopolyspora erythraea TaxID=1836 RepID=A4FK16_SACEN|nr:Nramp family divalent metal transporter [Saccharopolyspora erythraea]EQD86972.1 manganese transporter [Saccharopolyspora erythraea D]PFG98029.1 Mn2+/Fe2+ NRAMP family transporter [Saccharopolyspora erythraea NRRL 2338]QRK88148.1 Nramp family divalent metal transporter [Saccharopolyspora erythraea]CAM04391.1 Mn2+ and Fe2+ transporters of the NRAMP family-like protein [Saccharopolyspora erythraea NRRL 2338]
MGTDVAASDDPYLLTADGIKEPPRGWAASLRYLGPGLIVSASIVGSGELIATTALGAEAGFALLWMVILSTGVKVALQAELARWTISTGKPGLTGYNAVPPRFGRIGWISLLWIAMALSKLLQLGGIVGGVAVSLSLLIPVGADPLSPTSLAAWTLIVVAGSIALLYSNRYGLIERGAFLLVAVFSAVTVVIAFGLPFTPFSYSGADVAGGLALTIPAGALGAAVAMFGITGVGADEITFYTYWCVEKGYARWAGPPDGSDEWVRRARGWIRVMYKDVFLSWVIYTFSTLAFFVMGAAVLHPQGLVLEGNEMITTLSRMYTDTIGEWANVLFLLGAVAVLGSTLWASVPSWSRMYTNLFATLGVLDWQDSVARQRWLRALTVIQPVLWGMAYLFVSSPVVMVQIGGVATGIFLPAVVIATWYLRRTEVDPRLHGSAAFNVLLVVSSAAITLLGAYTILNVFGVGAG